MTVRPFAAYTKLDNFDFGVTTVGWVLAVPRMMMPSSPDATPQACTSFPLHPPGGGCPAAQALFEIAKTTAPVEKAVILRTKLMICPAEPELSNHFPA